MHRRYRSRLLFVTLPLLLLVACGNPLINPPAVTPALASTPVPRPMPTSMSTLIPATSYIEPSAITFSSLMQTAIASPRPTQTVQPTQTAQTARGIEGAIARFVRPTETAIVSVPPTAPIMPIVPTTRAASPVIGKATAVAAVAPTAQTPATVRPGGSTKPSGSQLVSRTFSSPSLGREMPYFIYLPVGYAESGKRYPVLYMLHGYGGSNTEWLSVGFPEEADREINTGKIPPMLIVFPQGDQAYWVNHANGGEPWGDYTAHDVVAQIDGAYRTVADAPHRAIGGLSMGAHGALQLALNYPGIFRVIGMHSPTLRDFGDSYDFFGDEAYFDAHDPAHLVQQHPDQARQLKIFVDVGEQDGLWHDKTVAFHDLLTRNGVPHEFHTWPGDHNGDYWGPHSRDYLHFYGVSLAPA